MKLVVATSKVSDGNMHIKSNTADAQVIANRTKFLANNGIDINGTTRISTIYEGDDYCRYQQVTESQKGDGMFDGKVITSDALVTTDVNHALFLPIADCIGAVIFDPNNQILMLSHLGRHALEKNGGYMSVKYLVDNFGVDPSELLVWLSPAPGSDTYPLFDYDNRSLKDVAFEQFDSIGILKNKVRDNPTDNSKDANYYSHSEFLKGNRPNDSRFAIVAMMHGD